MIIIIKILDNKVIVGISGGEYQTRGFIDAFDPVSGERHLRHNMSADGFYKGRLVKDLKKKKSEEPEEEIQQ